MQDYVDMSKGWEKNFRL